MGEIVRVLVEAAAIGGVTVVAYVVVIGGIALLCRAIGRMFR